MILSIVSIAFQIHSLVVDCIQKAKETEAWNQCPALPRKEVVKHDCTQLLLYNLEYAELVSGHLLLWDRHPIDV